MATFVSNLTNGQIDEKGFLRLIGSLLSQSGVVQPGSLAVSAQVTPDMSVQVAGGLTGHGVVFITSSGDTYHGWNTSNLNVTIATNSSGVTKTDAIVAYTDLTAGIATSNNPGALKFAAVRRSGANTGAPTSGEISTAVSGNPYVVLAYVTVGNGVGSINSGNVVDQRTFAQVVAGALTTSAITLGYTQITTSFTTTSTTPTLMTGLSLSVVVPAGGRKVKVTLFSRAISNNTASRYTQAGIWQGAVGSGTRISGSSAFSTTASQDYPCTCIAVITPSAGAVTFNASLNVAGGASTGTFSAIATEPAFLLAEAI